jgi:microcystin-dependent protein
MATVTGLTAERMQQIEAASVVDGEVVAGDLILTKHDGTQINAGGVVGPAGPIGPTGLAIPGEVKLWPGSSLPDPALYGKWVWADGAYYPVATYPKAAAHIATQWRTFAGASDPGAGNFRVPDLRGLVAAGLDAMPGGSRANRMSRSVAITIAQKTGEETHILSIPEMPSHYHNSFSVYANRNFAGMGNLGGNEASNQGDYGPYPIQHVQSAGGNGAHENVQPTVFVPYIVCLDG